MLRRHYLPNFAAPSWQMCWPPNPDQPKSSRAVFEQTSRLCGSPHLRIRSTDVYHMYLGILGHSHLTCFTVHTSVSRTFCPLHHVAVRNAMLGIFPLISPPSFPFPHFPISRSRPLPIFPPFSVKKLRRTSSTTHARKHQCVLPTSRNPSCPLS